MPRDANQFVRGGYIPARPRASLSHDLGTTLSAFIVGLLPAVASCDREPTHSSSATAGPSALPSVLMATRQPGRFLLRITSADADTPVEVSDATQPAVVIKTVKASDRERAFNDLFRAFGDVHLDLTADHHIPHVAMITLMEELRRTGFTHLQFAVRDP